MEVYLKPIISACYIFPILAIIFTIPYILYEYHKYGSLLVLRTGIVYTFIFYMLTSFFMTVLPLPPRESVTPNTASMLLVPFDAVRRTIATSGIVFSEPSTYINLLKNSEFWQIVFNILLLVPFGVYLRYYFKRPWWQVLIFSFLYSLFFELTQLSGLYGIYKYPYRFFDVDDLICNTSGGVLGYIITPLFVFMMPDRDKLDEIAYKKGRVVSEFRRGIAWCIDMFIVIIPAVVYILFNNKKISVFIYDIRYTAALSAYIAFIFILVTAISNGRTLGKALVNIQIVSSENKGKAGILRLAARYIILYVVGMPSVAYAYYIYRYIQTAGLYKGEWKYYAFVVCMAICVIIAVYMAIDLLLCLLSATRNMLYDRITKLTHISLAGRDYIAGDDAPYVNMVDKNAAIRAKNTEDEIDNSVLNRADDNNMDKKNNNKTVNEQNKADIGRKTESINKNNIKDTKASDTVKWRNTASDSTEEYIDEYKINLDNIELDNIDTDYVDVDKVNELLAEKSDE